MYIYLSGQNLPPKSLRRKLCNKSENYNPSLYGTSCHQRPFPQSSLQATENTTLCKNFVKGEKILPCRMAIDNTHTHSSSLSYQRTALENMFTDKTQKKMLKRVRHISYFVTPNLVRLNSLFKRKGLGAAYKPNITSPDSLIFYKAIHILRTLYCMIFTLILHCGTTHTIASKTHSSSCYFK